MTPLESMEKLVSLCKRRGFIFQSSEIYGGLASVWDYGPLGVEMKGNIKRAWWQAVVMERGDMEGLDAGIFMHPKVWQASGHVEGFTDPLIDCKSCKRRFKGDDLEDQTTCPECGGELTTPRMFNLMFRTHMGPVEETATTIYLRPETAQGIFTNFDNVMTTMRRKLPFGIAQIGKAFRNEITPGNFIFRTREFEQMEIEFFVKPGADQEWHEYWVQERLNWYKRFGIKDENLRLDEHGPDELAHYAKSCFDVEYQFPMGWSELEGIANRTDFDLTQHSKLAGRDLTFYDEEEKRRYIPYVIEPSAGVDRSLLAFLCDAYHEEKVKKQKRVVLNLHPTIAPIKAAVFPLLRNRPEIVEMAHKIADDIRPHFRTQYDDTASIGKLYRRQDEIGTPFCVTIDVDSLDDNQVTVRERTTMEQVRLPAEKVRAYIAEKLEQAHLSR